MHSLHRPDPGKPKRIALVLGGGGMKGFAHIGVFQALNALGIKPTLVAGTSIGSLLGAAYVAGISPEELAKRAIAMRRRDLFRLDHLGMIKDRMGAPSIYLEAPLRGLVESVVPRGTFTELQAPLFVNTVDLERGTQVVFGTPGLQDVNIQDAVYASCALPGFFPPGRADGRICVDGGVIDNLPVKVAALWADLIIAVDVGNSEVRPLKDVHARGFEVYLEQESGVYPRRHVELEVSRERCVGCGLCAAMAPSLMGLDSSGKAFTRTKVVEWSPVEGDFVGACPTNAIAARTLRQADLPRHDSEQLAG